MTPRFGKIPTPLEVVDAGLDSAAEIVQLPARLESSLATATQHTAEKVKAAIDKPKNYSEVPAPPGTVMEGGLDAAASLAGGVVEGISGIFNAVQQTGEGVKKQLDQLVR